MLWMSQLVWLALLVKIHLHDGDNEDGANPQLLLEAHVQLQNCSDWQYEDRDVTEDVDGTTQPTTLGIAVASDNLRLPELLYWIAGKDPYCHDRDVRTGDNPNHNPGRPVGERLLAASEEALDLK